MTRAETSTGGATGGPTDTAVKHALLAWFQANARDLPWRSTRDPYAILVSEVMLQQTQARFVDLRD